jgi:TP901 family phage tail tape measure protein
MGAEELAYKATLDISGFTNGIKGMSSSLGGIPKDIDGLVGSIGKLGIGFLAGAAGAASLGAAIGQSISKAAEYESILNKIGKATGEGAKGLEGIQAAAHGTQFSMTEAAGAAQQLSNALKTNLEITQALPGTLFLAKQANMDLGSAVTSVTSAMKLFHQPASAAQADANLLVVASRMSKTSVGELSSALSSCGPVAAQFGNSLSTTTAALGIMMSQGMQAPQAGMALKSGLEALITPSKSCAESLTALGVSVKDVDPNLHSIDEIINTLAKSGMTASDSLEIFGNRAGPGMYALISQGSEGLEKFKGNLEGVNAATEAAKGGTETFATNMKIFSAACEEAEISLGNALLPALTDLVGLCASGTLGLIDMGQALSSWTGGTVNSAIGTGSWLDNMVQGLIAFDEANYGDITDSGAATADTWSEAYEAQMRADTSEVDPFVLAAMKQQSTALGTAGGAAAGDEWVKAYGAEVENGYTRINGELHYSSTESYGSRLNTPQIYQAKGGKSYSSGAQLGSYQLGYYILNEDTSAAAWQLRTQRWGNESLDPKDPIGSANALYAKHLSEEGQKSPTQQFGRSATGDTIVINVPIQTNLYDIADTQQNIQKWANDNKAIFESAGGDIAEELYNAFNSKMLAESPALQESLTYVMKGLASPGSITPGLFNESLGNLIDAGVVGEKWQASMEQAAAGMQDVIVNAGEAIKTKMGDFGSAAGKAFEDGILTQTETNDLMGMAPALEQLKTQFPEQFSSVGGEAALALINALKNGDWEGAARIAADAFGKPFVENMTIWGTRGFKALSTEDLASLIANPEKMAQAVTDVNKFSNNTLQPAITKSMDEAKAAFKSGTWTDQQVYDSFIKGLDTVAQYIPPWMTQLKSYLDSGKITVGGFLNAYDQVTSSMNKTSPAIQSQTQHYNGLTTAINGTNNALNTLGSRQPILSLSPQSTVIPTQGQANPYLGMTMGALGATSFPSGNASPVYLVTPTGQAYTPTNPLPIVPAQSTTGGIISHSRNTSPFYSDYYWSGAYGEPNVTPPVSGFQSSGKRGIVPINQTGSPPTNPWTDQPIMSINQQAVQTLYGGKSLVMPSPDLLNPMVTGTQAQANTNLIQTNNQVKDSIISLTAEDGKFCEAMSAYGMQQEQTNGLFKQSSITFTDALTPMQRQLYNTSANLVSATADDGKFCEAISQYTLAQEDAIKQTEASYIGTTEGYNQIKGAVDDAKLHIMSTTPEIKSLGTNISGLCGNTQQLTIQNDNLGQSQQILIDSQGNLITSQLMAASINNTMSEESIRSAIEQADEYGNVNIGVQAVNNDLVKLTAENGQFCEAISAFGLAQENTVGIFKQSYIGMTQAYQGAAVAVSQIAQNVQASTQAISAGAGAGVTTISGTAGTWGGTSKVTGSGGWIGTGTTAGNPAFPGGSIPSWGGAAASSGLPGNYGSVHWASGGIATKPTWGVFGEGGPEAFIPLYDKAAGWAILQKILPFFTDSMQTAFLGGSASSEDMHKFLKDCAILDKQFNLVDKAGLPSEISKFIDAVGKLSSGYNQSAYQKIADMFTAPQVGTLPAGITGTGAIEDTGATEEKLTHPLWTGSSYLYPGMVDPRTGRDAAEAAATAETGTNTMPSLGGAQDIYTAANPLPTQAVSVAPQKVDVTNETLQVHDKRPPMINVFLNSNYAIDAKGMTADELLAALAEHDTKLEKDVLKKIGDLWE